MKLPRVPKTHNILYKLLQKYSVCIIFVKGCVQNNMGLSYREKYSSHWLTCSCVCPCCCVRWRCPVAGCQAEIVDGDSWWLACLLWSRSALSVATSHCQNDLNRACWRNAHNKQMILTVEVIRCRYLLSFHSSTRATEKLTTYGRVNSFSHSLSHAAPIWHVFHGDRPVSIPLLAWHLHSLVSPVLLCLH